MDDYMVLTSGSAPGDGDSAASSPRRKKDGDAESPSPQKSRGFGLAAIREKASIQDRLVEK